MPMPISGIRPSSHSTGSAATASARQLSAQDRVYQCSSRVVTAAAAAKNSSTLRVPSPMSPTTLAKPTMWTSMWSSAYLARRASSCRATCS